LAGTLVLARGSAEYKTSIIRGVRTRNAYQRLKARQDPSNPMHEVHRRHAGAFQVLDL